MRRKVRIFSTIVSLALVLAVMCVGIWAASSVTLSSTGTLTFNPTDVNATVAFADAVRHQAGELRSGVLQL